MIFQGEYLARFWRNWNVFNPLNILTTKQELHEAQERIKQGEKSLKDQYLVESMVHPDTGEIIFWPFRMSAVVPTNMGIILGMLTARRTSSIIFWQWLNQSMNVAVNYANANKTNETVKGKELALSYSAAVISSCSVAIGLNNLAKRHASKILKGAGPVVAASLAGIINVLLIRGNELKTGITIYDKDENELGKSKEAAKRAIGQVCFTRVATALTVLTIPQLIMSGVTRYRLPINLAVIGATLQVALPASLALFPQKSSFYSIEKGKLVYYNKGL